MDLSYFTRPQLRIISQVFCDLAVVWLVALLGTQDLIVLTMNLVAAIVSLRIALVAEKQLERYD